MADMRERDSSAYNKIRLCDWCGQPAVAENRAYCDTHLCMWMFTSGRRCWYRALLGGYCSTHDVLSRSEARVAIPSER